jgi:ATP-dependent protease HslVU (ClpYQ) peptidase subunit
MTCIAAFVEGGKAYVGGDAAATYNNDLIVRRQPKVFFNRGYVFGCAGSYRQMQVLRHLFQPPPLPRGLKTDSEFEAFLVGKFIPALRFVLKEEGVAEIVQVGSERSNQQSEMVVACGARLFTLESDYNVGLNAGEIATAGSGGPEARGALLALLPFKEIPARRKLEIALECSEACNASVRSPFTVLHT